MSCIENSIIISNLPVFNKKHTKVSFMIYLYRKVSELLNLDFESIFNLNTIENRMRELAFLNPGIQIILTDKRSSEEKIIKLKYAVTTITNNNMNTTINADFATIRNYDHF